MSIYKYTYGKKMVVNGIVKNNKISVYIWFIQQMAFDESFWIWKCILDSLKCLPEVNSS